MKRDVEYMTVIPMPCAGLLLGLCWECRAALCRSRAEYITIKELPRDKLDI
ncbi:MAG: hypothetical protein LBD23_06375 [Oscillospiraceae bacterium]|jgi:hypothetical protein|nr:hypothetical protein [Oscillospiraceae bacterium]